MISFTSGMATLSKLPGLTPCGVKHKRTLNQHVFCAVKEIPLELHRDSTKLHMAHAFLALMPARRKSSDQLNKPHSTCPEMAEREPKFNA